MGEDSKVEITDVDSEGNSIAMVALSEGRDDIATWCLEKGCPAHIRNQKGETLLIIAVKNDWGDFANKLLQNYNADVDANIVDKSKPIWRKLMPQETFQSLSRKSLLAHRGSIVMLGQTDGEA